MSSLELLTYLTHSLLVMYGSIPRASSFRRKRRDNLKPYLDAIVNGTEPPLRGPMELSEWEHDNGRDGSDDEVERDDQEEDLQAGRQDLKAHEKEEDSHEEGSHDGSDDEEEDDDDDKEEDEDEDEEEDEDDDEKDSHDESDSNSEGSDEDFDAAAAKVRALDPIMTAC